MSKRKGGLTPSPSLCFSLRCRTLLGTKSTREHSPRWPMQFTRDNPRGRSRVLSGVHPCGVNDGPFGQDRLKQANYSTMTSLGNGKANCGTVNTVRRRLSGGLVIFFSFLMLFRFLLSASIVAGALTPAAVEARSRCGIASWYGPGFHGNRTANGERFNSQALTAASTRLPYGSLVRVRNQDNGRSVVVRINDYGPHVQGRILDLSQGAFARIASLGKGVTRICYSRA